MCVTKTYNVNERWNVLVNFWSKQEKKDREGRDRGKMNAYEIRNRAERALEDYLQLEWQIQLLKDL